MKASRLTAYAQRLVQGAKHNLRELTIHIPLLGDLYLYYWVFPKTCAEYRGVFASYANALKAIPAHLKDGYNKTEFYAHYYQPNGIKLEEIGKFQAIDYPVLVWLREAFTDSSTIFDLGGNTGYSYFAYQNYLPYPSDLKWQVCDLPEAVKAGNELLQKFDSPGLSFTTNFADADGSDIFITLGALQYLEPSLSEILEQLGTKPRHLVIHHVPFYEGEEYFTLQNLLSSYVPYKIQNRSQFLATLSRLGYELIDSWTIARTCHIPFHPDCFVAAYHGFYLRLRNPTQPVPGYRVASQAEVNESAPAIAASRLPGGVN